MVNTSAPPTLAERLQNVPLGRLAVRLQLARSAFADADTAFKREKAAADISAIKAELKRRGEQVAD